MQAVKILFGVAVAWMLAGCHLTALRPEDSGAVRRFTQVSLFSTLLYGRYGGVVDLGWVKGRGNLMIATLERMAAADGDYSQIERDCVSALASDGR